MVDISCQKWARFDHGPRLQAPCSGLLWFSCRQCVVQVMFPLESMHVYLRVWWAWVCVLCQCLSPAFCLSLSLYLLLSLSRALSLSLLSLSLSLSFSLFVCVYMCACVCLCMCVRVCGASSHQFIRDFSCQGQYGNPERRKINGGRISHNEVQGSVDALQARSRKIPGPGQVSSNRFNSSSSLTLRVILI